MCDLYERIPLYLISAFRRSVPVVFVFAISSSILHTGYSG